PGTGKTFTITKRIFHLIEKKAVRSENILAVTFTRKAALEMHGRLEKLLTQTNHLPPLISTFHGFCWQLIQENQEEKKRLSIIDPDDRSMVLRDAINLAQKQGVVLSQSEQILSDGIAAIKQSILSIDEIEKGLINSNCPLEELVPVFSIYQNILKLNDLFDYEDVIFNVVKRLEEDSVFRSNCQLRFPYVFVDEYQDLNEGQYRIIRALAENPDANICVIGDPDQAIYGFRGSDVTYFTRFKQDYPNAEVVRLSRNYRSTETILKSSYQVIQKGRIKITDEPVGRTYSNIDGNRTISIMEAKSEKAEAVAIGRVIEQMVGGMGFHSVDFDKLKHYQDDVPRSFSDFAVLFRTHDQGRLIMEQLESAGIPCQMASRENLINTPGIKALLCLLNLADGVGTYTDFEYLSRNYTPNLSSAVVFAFKNWAYTKNIHFAEACELARQKPISHMVKGGQKKLLSFFDSINNWTQRIAKCPLNEKLEILSQAPAIQKLINNKRSFLMVLKKLVDRSTAYGLETAEFLAAMALDSDTDSYDGNVERVALMTMHAAKGLEFQVVFIAGCEEGLIPFLPNDGRKADPSEERRLFYVAMTRAKEILFFNWVTKRRLFGQMMDRKISPFVLDIERHLQEYMTTESKNSHSLKQTQLNLF
ncbi:MAG: ATP-dependent helicase, partial [Desulfobacteraceae bacterium]